jgi:hypothetical protein
MEADNYSEYKRNNVILYNPAKPSEIMTRLLAEKRFNFKPLTKMTTLELIDAYKQAKLYIDFGHFGGPERMPKEAVYFGCCILVGKRNAAENDFDIAIPDKYKIENYDNLEIVNAAIQSVIDKYQDCLPDFIPFRNKIERLESDFIQQIK